MNSAIPSQKKSLRFHARSFVAFTLSPEAPLEKWLGDLDRWTENSPGFFAGRPVLLDLSILKPAGDEIIARLVSQLATRGIRVYAIEAGDRQTLGPDLPPLLKGAKPVVIDEPHATGESKSKASALSEESADTRSLIIRSPIRSGQSILHQHGDVIVMGSVGYGSEIIAAGSIHVYGTLRGRAFAGSAGNSEARIFCSRNEAELLAVDGWYMTADEMEPATRGRPAQSFLDNGVIRVAPLD
ncbi:MAG TPA: septum site-determining protein MinC [Devosiaceae bacterium]|nr:septum site-determining protein MinC [Devosiaceae bacterium]